MFYPVSVCWMFCERKRDSRLHSSFSLQTQHLFHPIRMRIYISLRALYIIRMQENVKKQQKERRIEDRRKSKRAIGIEPRCVRRIGFVCMRLRALLTLKENICAKHSSFFHRLHKPKHNRFCCQLWMFYLYYCKDLIWKIFKTRVA